jgi:hypothetical protein
MGHRTGLVVDEVARRIAAIEPDAPTETLAEVGRTVIRGPILDAVGSLDH